MTDSVKCKLDHMRLSSEVTRFFADSLAFWLNELEQFSSGSQTNDFDSALKDIARGTGKVVKLFSYSNPVEKAWITFINLAISNCVRVFLTKETREQAILAALQIIKAELMLAIFELPPPAELLKRLKPDPLDAG